MKLQLNVKRIAANSPGCLRTLLLDQLHVDACSTSAHPNVASTAIMSIRK
jgi:hypothetical protein